MLLKKIFPALLSCGLCAAAAEWDDIKTQYKTCSLLAGLGQGNGLGDPNEWNNAEGLPATEAELSEPHSAMADIFGRIYIADKNANAIRRIDADGTIHTAAGMNRSELSGGGTNAGFNGDGPARERLLDGPQHAYVLPDGTFYILDTGNKRIRRVATDGMMTTILTDPVEFNRGLWVRRDGQLLYYCTDNQLKRWTPDLGTQSGTVVASGLIRAGNIDVDRTGNIFVSDRNKSAVYRIPPDYGGGTVTSSMIVAGTGTTKDSGRSDSGKPATQVGLFEVRGIAFHPLGGYFLVTHAGSDVWYVDAAGIAWLFIQGSRTEAHNASPFAVPATDHDELSEPRCVSVAPNGDVIVASNDAGFIRIIRSELPPPAPPRWDDLTFLPGTGNRLRWQSKLGEWYLLEQSPSLFSGTWSKLSLAPGTGAISEYIDPEASSVPRRYYRLHSIRAWPN
jgi:DNA-binding beta-propeller fold protein YncE